MLKSNRRAKVEQKGRNNDGINVESVSDLQSKINQVWNKTEAKLGRQACSLRINKHRKYIILHQPLSFLGHSAAKQSVVRRVC